MATHLVHPTAEGRRAYRLPDSVPVGILIQLDGQPLRIDEDGQVEPVLAGGWPRPGAAHATARRRP